MKVRMYLKKLTLLKVSGNVDLSVKAKHLPIYSEDL